MGGAGGPRGRIIPAALPAAAFLWLLSLGGGTLPGQDEALAFKGARLIPVSGPEIAEGTLVIHRGHILALGPAESTRIPRGARVIDAAGRVIMPGLVCSHTHVGSPAGGDQSGPLHPGVRVLDAVDIRDPGIARARAGGLTTINVMSGSGHLLSGQTVYLKLRKGRVLEDLLIHTPDGGIAGGMKMANGTNSQGKPPFPGTRGRSAFLVRKMFLEAQEYRRRIQRAGDDRDKLPPRDLGKEALLEVLDGRRVVHFHTHRHDDILTVLRLSREFGFRVVLHHVSEGWKVAREIAAAGAPASVIVIDSPGGKLEAMDLALETGGILDRAGVLVGFHTDDPITDSRLFARSAALAVRAGMARDKALAALTLANARILDLQDRIGSLEPGKDADLAVFSGDPLSVYSHVLETWVEGRRVFDRRDPKDLLVATGGYGAGDRRDFHGCCFGGTGDER